MPKEDSPHAQVMIMPVEVVAMVYEPELMWPVMDVRDVYCF